MAVGAFSVGSSIAAMAASPIARHRYRGMWSQVSGGKTTGAGLVSTVGMGVGAWLDVGRGSAFARAGGVLDEGLVTNTPSTAASPTTATAAAMTIERLDRPPIGVVGTS
jgi:hypothetical protein